MSVIATCQVSGARDDLKKSWHRRWSYVDWGAWHPVIPVRVDDSGREVQPLAKVGRDVVYGETGTYHYRWWLDRIESGELGAFQVYLHAIGAEPVVIVDVDERPDRSSRLDQFRRLWSVMGDGDFDALPYVSTYRGGRHYYFRVPERLWLSVMFCAPEDSDLRIDLRKQKVLGFGDTAILDGVEVLVAKPVFGMFSRRGGVEYKPHNFPRSVLELPELPEWMIYLLSGGKVGSCEDRYLRRLVDWEDSVLQQHLSLLFGRSDVRVVTIDSDVVASEESVRQSVDDDLVMMGLLKNPDVELWGSFIRWLMSRVYGASGVSRVRELTPPAGCRARWQLSCPFHEDDEPSMTLSVNGKLLVRCHACTARLGEGRQSLIYYSMVALFYIYLRLTGRVAQSQFDSMMYGLECAARYATRQWKVGLLGWVLRCSVWSADDVTQVLHAYYESSWGRKGYKTRDGWIRKRVLDKPRVGVSGTSNGSSSGSVRSSAASFLESSGSMPVSPSAGVSTPLRGGDLDSSSDVPAHVKLSRHPRELDKWYRRRYADKGIYVIGEMVRLGMHVCIAGLPGSYKSTLLRNIAYVLAGGGQLFGRPCARRRVLYVNFDDMPRKLASSLARMVDRLDPDAVVQIMDCTDPAVDAVVTSDYAGDYVSAIAACADSLGVDVVIIDGLNHLIVRWASFFGHRVESAINDYGVVSMAMRDINSRIMGADRVLFTTIHVPKSSPKMTLSSDNLLADMGYSPMGSVAIHGGIDALWAVGSVDASERIQKICQVKNREAGYVEYLFFYDEDMLFKVREECKYDYERTRRVRAGRASATSSDSGSGSVGVDKPISESGIIGDGSNLLAGGVQQAAGGVMDDSALLDAQVLPVEGEAIIVSGGFETPEGSPENRPLSGSGVVSVSSEPDDFSSYPHVIARLDRIVPYYRYRLDVSDAVTDDTIVVLDRAACPDHEHTYYLSVRRMTKEEGALSLKMDPNTHFLGYSLLHALTGYRAYQNKTPRDVRTLVFDIEASNIDPNLGQVIAIGYKYIDGDRVQSDVFVGDEHAVLSGFFSLLKDLDPEWLVGYNIFDFDIPYLLTRARHLGLEWEWLDNRFYRKFISFRAGTQQIDVGAYFARAARGFENRAVIDLYLLAHRYLQSLESYSLVSAYGHITGESVDVLGDKSVMGEWDPELVRRQVLRDVDMTHRVLDALIVIPFALVEYVPSIFSEILYQGNATLWSRILTMDYIRRGLPIRVGDPREITGYDGAISICRRVGLFGRTAKADVVSLYPNIIVQHNIHSDRDYAAIMPFWVKRLLDERVRLKKLAKETGDPMVDARQNALKVIINSAYGFLGTSGIYWSHADAAATVTRIGRETLLAMEKLIAAHHLPIELDTDGILFAVSPQGMPPEELVPIIEREIGFKLDLEYYDACVSVAAKNYALLDGDKVIIKGSSLKNRSGSKYIMRVMRRVLKELLVAARDDGRDLDHVMELIDREASSMMDASVVPEDVLVERLVASKRTADRKDVEWDLGDEELVLSGKSYYIYYAVGKPRRVVSVGMPSERGLVLDRVQYVRKFYDALKRLMPIHTFRDVFTDRFGGRDSFVSRYALGQSAMDFG